MISTQRTQARKACHQAAVASGDRAYTFIEEGHGLLEVRVWPDGTTHLTPVNPDGTARRAPRRALVRAGGLRAQRLSPGLLALAGVLALAVEQLT